MSKIGDKLKSIFTVDFDDEFDDDYYDDFDDEIVEENDNSEKPLNKKRERTFIKEEPVSEPVRTQKAAPVNHSRISRPIRNNKVVPLRSEGMEVCVVKPTQFESSKEVIDYLLEGKAVVLNLEGIKLDVAQRIVDLVFGGCYAISGRIQKISTYIYLVTPNSVDISGDFQDLPTGETPNVMPSYTSRRTY